jgi:hypothetical protein
VYAGGVARSWHRQAGIEKLGTVDVDKAENSPVVFRGKLYRCEWFRNAGCFHFVDCENGRYHTAVCQGLVFRQRVCCGLIFYSRGSQQGVEHLAEAVYEGSVAEFLRGRFPETKR